MDPHIERFARQIILREIGGPGQKKLGAARVLIIGAGGLGCPAALYLAAAGIGFLRVVDADLVSLSNLQRQILFRTSDIGRPKVAVMAEALCALNPELAFEGRAEWFDAQSGPDLLSDCDLVLDGCDDYATRLLVNAAAFGAGKPLISGALGAWEGQLGLFHPAIPAKWNEIGAQDGASTPQASPADRRTACYQCFLSEIPPDQETCATQGIIGALPGIIGSMMALEAIKWILGMPTLPPGSLRLVDGRSGAQREVRVLAEPDCPICGSPKPGLAQCNDPVRS